MNDLNVKNHTEEQTGPKRWSEKLSLKKDVLEKDLQITDKHL